MKEHFLKGMEGALLGQADLVGVYERPGKQALPESA
jgi:hypothetical protein